MLAHANVVENAEVACIPTTLTLQDFSISTYGNALSTTEKDGF